MAKTHAKKLARASFFCGLGSLVLFVITGLPAIILGRRSRRIASLKGQQPPGLARAGIILGYLSFVIDGSLGVFLADGTQIAELGAGDVVGEMSLVEKRPPTVSVKALSDCRLLSVPQGKLRAEDLEELSLRYVPELQMRAIHSKTRRVVQLACCAGVVIGDHASA